MGGCRAREAIGVNATGLPFNSVMAIKLNADRTMNPMVNARASRASPARPALDEEVYASETATNQRNQGSVRLRHGYGRMYSDPDEATEIDTRKCTLLVAGERPTVITGVMRGADAPGADGPANLLAVLNYDLHAARFVQTSHTALPSAFASPLVGPCGAVIEGMRAGHVPAEAAEPLDVLAARMPVVLASRCMTGPVSARTYGYAAGEIDLIARRLIPGGFLSGLKVRLLLGLALRQGGGRDAAAAAFVPYQSSRRGRVRGP